MTTAELTEKFSHLTKEEQLAISKQVDAYLADHDAKKYFRPYTKAELIAILKKSHEEAATGHTISHQELLAHIREKYGIPA